MGSDREDVYSGQSQIRVGLFLRHPRSGFHSIETVFATVRQALPKRIATVLKVSPRPSRGIMKRIYSALHAATAMRRQKIQVAHVLGDEHFLALALPRNRTVLTIHDCDGLVQARGFRGMVLRLLWLHLPVRTSAAVTTVSERSRAQVIALTGCAPEHVRVIENPLSARFEAAPLPPGRARILHVGTKPNKNLDRLIDAVAGLDVELTVIGSLTEAYARRLQDASIQFENMVDASEDDLLRAYRECTLLAFVSTSEGFGMPIIEAQATGRPVLTSDLSPMREVAGDAALLVDPCDVAAIRDGLVRLLHDGTLRDELAERGLKNVRRFSAQHIAERYAVLYEEVASKNGKSALRSEGGVDSTPLCDKDRHCGLSTQVKNQS